MNKSQYESIDSVRKVSEEPFYIRSWEFTTDNKPRTLLYGYNTDREDWHVYLYKRHVHRVVGNSTPCRLFMSLNELVPCKRLYPDACDYDFCVFLKRKGIALPFTAFSSARTPHQFYGRVPQLDLSVLS